MNVSRETLARLENYAATLKKWNPKINLVAKSTIDELWERHIVDSLQIISHIPDNTEHLLDMGSGGGFPGLVIAITASELKNPKKTSLLESDQRKSAFLRTILRETQTSANVITDRIEKAAPQEADVITARALADLGLLLEFTERHLKPNGKALFLKGRNWKQEVEDAQKAWTFEWNPIQSKTESEAVLLEIKGIQRV